jgi:regulator of protease activity HflC (stomatin/prohibitin superfamily)
MKRNQWAAALLPILLFLSGAVVGALAHRYYAETVVSARTAEDFRQHYVSEMKSKLNLTPEQVSQLEKILDETKARYKAVRDEYHPAMLKIKNEQISRVKAILTPEQVPVYEQLVAERERRATEQEARERKQEQEREARRRASP